MVVRGGGEGGEATGGRNWIEATLNRSARMGKQFQARARETREDNFLARKRPRSPSESLLFLVIDVRGLDTRVYLDLAPHHRFWPNSSWKFRHLYITLHIAINCLILLIACVHGLV
jgi:hypothetical protein